MSNQNPVLQAALQSTIVTGVIKFNNFPHQVIEFNQRVLNIEPRELGALGLAEYDISVKCLNEEIKEFVDAYTTGDVIGQIDAMIDLMYFAQGVLYKMGLTADSISKCCTAVHEKNMEKKLGVNFRRGDGTASDAVKGEGWVGPEAEICRILDEQ
jgi:phosphoribosyl-ATP pyrophosphohydrolase